MCLSVLEALPSFSSYWIYKHCIYWSVRRNTKNTFNTSQSENAWRQEKCLLFSGLKREPENSAISSCFYLVRFGAADCMLMTNKKYSQKRIFFIELAIAVREEGKFVRMSNDSRKKNLSYTWHTCRLCTYNFICVITKYRAVTRLYPRKIQKNEL